MNLKIGKNSLLSPGYLDPIMTYPFVVGMRERQEGKPFDKKRWLTTHQQRAWAEGWTIMDELETLRGRPLPRAEEPPAPEE
jgi:hypothetical protein